MPSLLASSRHLAAGVTALAAGLLGVATVALPAAAESVELSYTCTYAPLDEANPMGLDTPLDLRALRRAASAAKATQGVQPMAALTLTATYDSALPATSPVGAALNPGSVTARFTLSDALTADMRQHVPIVNIAAAGMIGEITDETGMLGGMTLADLGPVSATIPASGPWTLTMAGQAPSDMPGIELIRAERSGTYTYSAGDLFIAVGDEMSEDPTTGIAAYECRLDDGQNAAIDTTLVQAAATPTSTTSTPVATTVTIWDSTSPPRPSIVQTDAATPAPTALPVLGAVVGGLLVAGVGVAVTRHRRAGRH